MLNKSIETLKGIGDKRKESLNVYGIYTIKDLLFHFPYKYKDITKREFFSEKENEDEIVSFVKVVSKPFYKRKSSILNFLSFYVSDGRSKAKCTFFNQPYLMKSVSLDDEFIILGTVKKELNAVSLVNPKIIHPDEDTPDILTQYRLPKTISQKSFVTVIKKAFLETNSQLQETLPETIRLNYNLCTVNFAVEQIHFPSDMRSLDMAQKRLAFEEMFFFMLVLRNLRKSNMSKKGIRLSVSDETMRAFTNQLPYSLTNAQNKVISEIRHDMSGENKKIHVMNRLLQGDVGCGKTVVAMAAIYVAFSNGYQSAMMAPTEILANQHYEDCKKVLAPLGVKVSVLTSSMSAAEKAEVKEDISSGKLDLIVGTHALIQSSVLFSNLGLAITDEQHRFGVNQRAMLSQKGNDCHMLVMSATPVPRTLALILYGDLDISSIDELPPGRKMVKTRLVDYARRQNMYKYIAENIKKDEQAYIVCPLIDESEKLDAMSATEVFDELKAGFFKDINIGLLHGKISDDEKKNLIDEFSAGRLRALVSTTVIEVGVNVPNATIMVIENGERFGLAQLHQLRGRVGRGNRESWCFITTKTHNSVSIDRINTIICTNDGFEIAQKDLDMRGPGQFIGMRQSGLLDKRVIALINDYDLVQTVKQAVDKTENGEFGDCITQLHTQAAEKYKEILEDIVLN